MSAKCHDRTNQLDCLWTVEEALDGSAEARDRNLFKGRRFIRWCENSFLGGLPQYQLVKSMAEGLARVESAEGVQPALVSIEDGWQIAYLLEPLENGWVTVFLPQAPTPMSGNVMYLPADRVRPLNITMVQAMTIVKHIGVGSAETLRVADLRLPAGA